MAKSTSVRPMTCIAGIVTNTKIAYMGADSAAGDSQLSVLMADPKVQAFGNVLVGYAGSIAAGRAMFQLIEERQEAEVARFVEKTSAGRDFKDVSFMVIEAGQIYEIEQGSSIRYLQKYAAIGSGAQVALGALYIDHKTINSVVNAIDAAATFSPNVRQPAVVISCPSI